MRRDQFSELARLTAAIRQAEAGRMRRIAAQEADLRTDLAALDAMRAAAGEVPAVDLAGPRRVGADMLWQAWAGRARGDIQLRLARVLAQKGAAMRALRIAHGRDEAAAALCEQARRARAEAHAIARMTDMQGLFALKPGSDEPL